ncbi:MAG: inorganic phosphate transporter [Clostridia bacterium]|nr:inorganic phosphate transporter [Clostridia bacterium]
MILFYTIFAVALFIDGGTDCANSVTGAVSSGALSLRRATVLSAALSFLGCFIFCGFFPTVAVASASPLSFPAGAGRTALFAVLLSVSLWSAAAWLLALPTSEGHGLIAAAAGSALALGGSIRLSPLLFIILSAPAAALLCAAASFFITGFIKNNKNDLCRAAVIASGALSSFFHGAQDGQKFLALALSTCAVSRDSLISFAFFAAVFMALGTLCGGRIVKKMSSDMASADLPAALGADVACGLTLALLTLIGIPASTTHLKMTALYCAARCRRNPSSPQTLALLAAAWFSTFPICFVLSFFLSKLFFAINL